MSSRPLVLITIAYATLLSLASCSAVKKGVSHPYGSKPSSKPAAPPPPVAGNSRPRVEAVQYAQKFVGTPYKYAGVNPATGFDCSGFTSFVMRGFGVQLSPASAQQAGQGRKVSLDLVQAGDLLFFSQNSKNVSHVALVVKRDNSGITCVHATTSRGVIVENVTASTYWKPKILFARDVMSK